MFRLTFVHLFSLLGDFAAEYGVYVNVDVNNNSNNNDDNEVDVMNPFLLGRNND